MRQLANGFCGKVPSAGDFQRSLPPSGPASGFFDWFNDGWVRTVLVGRRPDLEVPIRFALRTANGAATTIGVMRASRDRVGRRFPLFVFATFLDVDDFGPLIYLAADWRERVFGVAEAGSRGLDIPMLRSHVESLRCEVDEAKLSNLREWASSQEAKALCPDANLAVREWLRSLEFAFSGARRPAYVVRGRCGAGSMGFSVLLSLLRRLAGSNPEAVFWVPDGDGVAWRATWEYPASRHFEPLMWHDVAGSSAYDTEPGRVQVPDSFVGRAANLVEESSTILHLLENVTNAYAEA